MNVAETISAKEALLQARETLEDVKELLHVLGAAYGMGKTFFMIDEALRNENIKRD
jgi:K+-sensing histidine kinase KdpD